LLDPPAVEPRVIVVTGASAGVGRAAARRFARDGARVALLARGSAGLEGARRDVEALGGIALVVRCDVALPRQVESAAEHIERALGPIDVWVNAAMVTVQAPFLMLEDEELRRVTDVTYLGVVHGTRAALRRMLPRDRGTIVQVGSALAARGMPLQSAYAGAKQAVLGFTESIRGELALGRSRVWVTTVTLPAVNTPRFEWLRSKLPRRLQPVPPIFTPEVAAEAIHFAAGARRRQVVAGRAAVARAFVRLGRGGDVVLEREDPHRRDNLFAPADEHRDHGARGRFVFGSRTLSVQLWATMHRNALALAGAGLALTGLALLRLRWSGRLAPLLSKS
jgi:NAD(P)-dependent dehydrogenase (short-subunit alcohol dehydrogenase family)